MEKNQKFVGILTSILSSSSSIVFFLSYHLYYLNLPDAPNTGAGGYIVALVTFILLSVSYLVAYFLNLFIFKNTYVNRLMNIVSSGTFIFFAIGVVILFVASTDRWVFDNNNISLFVSSAFTLLGFGLAIVAIAYGSVVSKVNNALANEKRDYSLFDIIIPYGLLFIMGLVFSISSLLNIQFSDTVFYKITVYQALFYSSAQILMIVFVFIRSFTRFLIEKI